MLAVSRISVASKAIIPPSYHSCVAALAHRVFLNTYGFHPLHRAFHTTPLPPVGPNILSPRRNFRGLQHAHTIWLNLHNRQPACFSSTSLLWTENGTRPEKPKWEFEPWFTVPPRYSKTRYGRGKEILRWHIQWLRSMFKGFNPMNPIDVWFMSTFVIIYLLWAITPFFALWKVWEASWWLWNSKYWLASKIGVPVAKGTLDEETKLKDDVDGVRDEKREKEVTSEIALIERDLENQKNSGHIWWLKREAAQIEARRIKRLERQASVVCDDI